EGSGGSLGCRERVETSFVQAHRGFDVGDMHGQALLDSYCLTTNEVTTRRQFKAFAFEFLDRQVNAVAVGGQALDHWCGLLGSLLHDGLHLLNFGLHNLEIGLGSGGHLLLSTTLQLRAVLPSFEAAGRQQAVIEVLWEIPMFTCYLP